jgi:rRNA maturation protein Nop10
MSAKLIRRLYPRLSTCPRCGSRQYQPAGSSGARRFRRCTACGETYPVSPIALECDLGGPTSVAQPL